MARTRSSLLRRTLWVIRPARQRRGRFWLEVVLGLACAVLSVATLVTPDWIEAVFHVDPDRHSGTLEWSIDAALLAAAVTAGALARREARRPRPVPAASPSHPR
jgi:hypothetical protein